MNAPPRQFRPRSHEFPPPEPSTRLAHRIVRRVAAASLVAYALDSSTERRGVSMRNLLAVAIVILSAHVSAQAQQGWYPHEGSMLRYRVNARFGLEPNTM